MEANRGEAERCIRTAIEAVNARDFQRATTYLDKAEQLYPLACTKKIIQQVNKLSGVATSAKKQAPKKTKIEEDYTIEQVEIVRRIQKCKELYEILGVMKEATSAEIKRAYNKLILRVHPDKNRAPGAAEAFIAVANALAVLTDPDKRRDYDMNKRL